MWTERRLKWDIQKTSCQEKGEKDTGEKDKFEQKSYDQLIVEEKNDKQDVFEKE